MSILVILFLTGCGQHQPNEIASDKKRASENDRSVKKHSPSGQEVIERKPLEKVEEKPQLDISRQTTEIELDWKVQPDDFENICKATNLETLILDGGGVEPVQISKLLVLTKLEHLRIRNCAVDDDGIDKLVNLKNLRIVNLPQAVFSNQSIAKLVELPKLQLLRFSSPNVDDQGMERLKHAKELRAIHLIRVKVTDKSVDSFCAIKSLESLYLDGSDLSDDGYSKILKKRPDIHLHVDQVHLDYDPNKHEHQSSNKPKILVK